MRGFSFAPCVMWGTEDNMDDTVRTRVLVDALWSALGLVMGFELKIREALCMFLCIIDLFLCVHH